MGRGSLFGAARDMALAAKVSIASPGLFRESIRELKKDGITLKERRALVLAQNRATAQLSRKNLSFKERVEFRKISGMRIPRVTK